MSEHTYDNVYKLMALNGDIVFRLAKEDDLPKLEWMGEYTHFRRVFQYTFREQNAGRRLMLLADFNHFPIGQIFILVREDNIMFNPQQRGYLYSLRVMTPFQGLGIGTELILQAEEIMRQRNMYYSTIAVAKENEGALRLYKRNGYTIYAEDEGRWSYTDHNNKQVYVHEPCWMLEKVLRSPVVE
jgi:ribosomal protein S18 acetylase RimI-like enzyme